MPSFEDRWEEVSDDLPAEDVQELIGIVPSSTIRWGISIISGFFILALIGSYFFKYPDIIKSDANLITENPPVSIIAKRDGIIENIFVENNQMVSKNQLIAELENPISYADIKKLKTNLQDLNLKNLTEIKPIQNINLGEITTYYNQLHTLAQELENFNRQNYYSKRLKISENKYDVQNTIIEKLEKKKKLLSSKSKIDSLSYLRDSLLNFKEVTSEANLMSARSKYIEIKANFEDLLIQIETLKLDQQEIKEQIINYQYLLNEEITSFKTLFFQYMNDINSKIKEWENINLLNATKSGEVVFTKIWNEKQFVSSNEKVCTIIPEMGGAIIARLIMPSLGSGRVKEGQKVIIKLNDFPYRKFGTLEGRVKNISNISERNENNKRSNYIVEVEIKNGMQTNYDKILNFSQNMDGTAEIITENNRLIEKIVLPIKDILISKFQL